MGGGLRGTTCVTFSISGRTLRLRCLARGKEFTLPIGLPEFLPGIERAGLNATLFQRMLDDGLAHLATFRNVSPNLRLAVNKGGQTADPGERPALTDKAKTLKDEVKTAEAGQAAAEERLRGVGLRRVRLQLRDLRSCLVEGHLLNQNRLDKDVERIGTRAEALPDEFVGANRSLVCSKRLAYLPAVQSLA